MTACLGLLTTIINGFCMENTPPRLEDFTSGSSESYVLLDDDDRGSQDDTSPKTPNALSTVFTSLDSAVLSESLGEAMMDIQQQVCPIF